MTELKTLKDFLKKRIFIENNENREIVSFGELKSNAINRWKFFKMCHNYSNGADQCSYLQGKMDEIKDNFNLTEEDLQENDNERN